MDVRWAANVRNKFAVGSETEMKCLANEIAINHDWNVSQSDRLRVEIDGTKSQHNGEWFIFIYWNLPCEISTPASIGHLIYGFKTQ